MKLKNGIILGAIVGFTTNIIILLFLPSRKVVCRDGWESPSIGIIGACSHHGGVEQDTRLFFAFFFSVFLGLVVTIWYISKQYKEDEKIRNIKEAKEKERLEELKRNSPSCPICSNYMTKRVAKKGKYIGKEFWGCSNYPKCKGIINIDLQE